MRRKKKRSTRKRRRRRKNDLSDVIGLTVDASTMLIGTSAGLAVASQVSKTLKK